MEAQWNINRNEEGNSLVYREDGNDRMTIHLNLALSSEFYLNTRRYCNKKIQYSAIKGTSNVQFYTPFYKWSLIARDPDDDNYTDCAIAGAANFIVTEDNHFAILRTIPFPK